MLLAVALLLQAAPGAPVTVVAPPRKERRICREMAGTTGSRLGGARECHTAAEWKAQQTELDARALNAATNLKGFGDGQIASDRPAVPR